MKKLTINDFEKRIDAARGVTECDLVLRGAKWLDVFSGEWLSGDIGIVDGVIVGVGEKYKGKKVLDFKNRFLVPGFIDSHLHIESTLMTPQEFERAVLPRGTTGAVVDPHEIVNVLGVRGLEYVLECAEKSFIDLYVMLSSCVPATHLETSGAKLSAQDLLPFKHHPKALGLAEMMNYPGVLYKDRGVLEKLYEFQDVHIDGHSPMLRGRDLNAYLACGIKTCHESVSLPEAREKLQRGMQVLLREGSVAKNLKELVGILDEYSSPHVSLCTDDRNPADILDEGHLDYMIRVAIQKGVAPEVAYRTASLSTAKSFGIKNKGALAPGYGADIVVLKNVKKCQVADVIKNGKLVSKEALGDYEVQAPIDNSIRARIPTAADLHVPGHMKSKGQSSNKVRVIGIIKDSIVTESLTASLPVDDMFMLQNDLKKDILKIAVVERYGHGRKPSVGFVKGMGIKSGAVGSSVGHDSHNMVAIGTNDLDMVKCFERMKEMGGGFVVVRDGKVLVELALPIAGLMTTASLREIYESLIALRKQVKSLGCKLTDPFLQMAFLCLAVIPSLKITDQGLVDVEKFEFVSVNLEN